MTHREYLDYLSKYAAHFNLLASIRFGCAVVDISPKDGVGWRVRIRLLELDEEEVSDFDAVVVCSGIHRVPHVPAFMGLEHFRGQILHAANYKDPSSLRGTSAVFIGGGESGSDIVGEASRTLERSYLSLRRGVFVLPRFLNGRPNDYTGTRLLYSLPEFLSRRSDVEAKRLRHVIGLALFPLSLLRAVLIWGPKFFRMLKNKTQAVDARQMKIEAIIGELRAEAGGNQFETFATKTEAFVEALVDGRCELRPGIREVTPTGVIFEDGKAVEIDSIVLCTGYEKPTTPFLGVPIDLERLYKNCFTSMYRETLAFIGFIRPPIGSIPPMSELQARWFAQLLSGRLTLPSADEMQSQVEGELASRATYHHRVFKRLPHLVDYSTYMDGLADLIDCKPRLLDFVWRPRLLYKLYTSAFSGVQYRFRGPHAQPEMATKIILHAKSHARVVRFLDLSLAEMARLIGLTRFQPHLSLLGKIRDRTQSRVA